MNEFGLESIIGLNKKEKQEAIDLLKNEMPVLEKRLKEFYSNFYKSLKKIEKEEKGNIKIISFDKFNNNVKVWLKDIYDKCINSKTITGNVKLNTSLVLCYIKGSTVSDSVNAYVYHNSKAEERYDEGFKIFNRVYDKLVKEFHKFNIKMTLNAFDTSDDGMGEVQLELKFNLKKFLKNKGFEDLDPVDQAAILNYL